ncbi:MAG TPA: lytic transglycosylase domain-containing protein [Thermoanaerobaculia bacterium]|jgi:soluble lytic murein transglycosylase-like protein|nr:lytic transglycosylase domain-containing protein [Thermoanaerobaculia bacterium]
MKLRNVIVVTLVVVAASSASADRKFSAANVPSARLKKPGRVVISNDHRAITAHRFFGNIREALVSIRSTRTLAFRPFAGDLFNSRASVKAPRELAGHIEDASRLHGVDPRLVAAVARRESAWRADVVSNKGAIGIMQLMPDTAKYLGVENAYDARQNIFGGTRYLRTLLDTFHGDLDLTLAAYNAGPGAVAKYHGVPPYRETQNYVAAVRATYEKSLLQ